MSIEIRQTRDNPLPRRGSTPSAWRRILNVALLSATGLALASAAHAGTPIVKSKSNITNNRTGATHTLTIDAVASRSIVKSKSNISNNRFAGGDISLTGPLEPNRAALSALLAGCLADDRDCELTVAVAIESDGKLNNLQVQCILDSSTLRFGSGQPTFNADRSRPNQDSRYELTCAMGDAGLIQYLRAVGVR